MLGRVGGNQKFKNSAKPRRYRRHFIRRFEERFGVKLNNNQHQQIINMIKKRKAKFLQKKSRDSSLWLVELEGMKFKCVYVNSIGGVVTAYK